MRLCRALAVDSGHMCDVSLCLHTGRHKPERERGSGMIYENERNDFLSTSTSARITNAFFMSPKSRLSIIKITRSRFIPWVSACVCSLAVVVSRGGGIECKQTTTNTAHNYESMEEFSCFFPQNWMEIHMTSLFTRRDVGTIDVKSMVWPRKLNRHSSLAVAMDNGRCQWRVFNQS